MAVAQLRRVTYVECPACHWTKAVLAYENPRQRCVFCPCCELLWDTTNTAREVRADLNHPTELRKQPEGFIQIDRDLDRRVAALVAHVRRTLTLLNEEARVRLPAIVQADRPPRRRREPLFTDADARAAHATEAKHRPRDRR